MCMQVNKDDLAESSVLSNLLMYCTVHIDKLIDSSQQYMECRARFSNDCNPHKYTCLI